MNNCTFGCMNGIPCENQAEWRNQNGVEVCDTHKIVLDAFTWENREDRKWVEIKKGGCITISKAQFNNKGLLYKGVKGND